jgi:phosphoribulokinase
MHEDLRVFFKTKRDVNARGYSEESVLSTIEKRRNDAEKFIQPQAKFADLIISIAPVGSVSLVKFRGGHIPNLKVRVQTKRSFNEHSLIRVLIGICGLHVDITSDLNSGDSILVIEGECQSEDIALAVNLLCPNLKEFFDLNPKWEAGALGIMQLIAVSHISQVMTKGTK